VCRLDCGPGLAKYQAAQLPDGHWAVRLTRRTEFGARMAVPWRAFPTREVPRPARVSGPRS